MSSNYFNWENKQEIIAWCIIILSSVLILSPMGSNKLLVFSGVFVVEIVLFPIILIAYSHFNSVKMGISSLFYSGQLFIVLLCTLALFFVGGISGDSITGSYSMARSMMFFFIGWWFVSVGMKVTGKHKLLYLLAIIIVLSVLSSVYYYEVDSPGIKSPYSLSVLCLLALLAVEFKNKKFLFFVIFTVGLLSVKSSFRSYWLALIFLYSGLFYTYFRDIFILSGTRVVLNSNKILQLSALIIVCTLLSTLLASHIYEWIASDPSRYHQIIYKSQELFNTVIYGDTLGSSEAERLGQLSFLLVNWGSFILPGGFQNGSSLFTMHDSSPVKDSVYMYLSVVLGMVLAIPSICYVILRLAIGYNNTIQPLRPLFLSIIFIIVIIFFTQGAVLMKVSDAFYLGTLLAYLTRREGVQCN